MTTSDSMIPLHRALGALRSRDLLRRALEAAGLQALAWIGCLLVLHGVERLMDPTLATRAGLGVAAVLVLAAALGAGLVHVLRGPDRRQAVWWIENGLDGKLAARLATALQFGEEPGRGGHAPALVEACATEAAELLEGEDPARSIRFGRARRALGGALVLALLLLGLVGTDPLSHLHLLARFVGPGLGVEFPLPVEFTVRPGSTRLLAGTRFSPEVEVRGRLPGELVAVRRMARGDREVRAVGAPGTRAGAVDYGAVHESFGYHFELGPYRSPTYRVEVVDPPRLEEIRLRYEYPAYTGLEPRLQRGGDLDLVAPRGTRIHVRVDCTRPLRRAWVRLTARGDAPPLELEGELDGEDPSRVLVVLPVEHSGTWQILFEDVEGFRDPAPGLHRLLAEEDAPPKVYVLEPGKDLELPPGPGPALPVRIHATDAYGLEALAVEYEVVNRTGFTEERSQGLLEIPVAAGATEVTTAMVLDLSAHELAPGDRIGYRARARDGRPGGGEEARGYTHRYQLRVPYPRDEHAEMAREGGEQRQTLEELLEAQREWEARLDRTLREVSADGEMTWRERRELEGLVEEEKGIRRKARELAAEMENTIEQARRSGVVDAELEEKSRQVQELLRQVADEKMHELLDELRELMSQVKVDPGKVKEMRRQMSRDSQADRLERMLEALRRLKTLQEIERARSEAESLAREQEALREETARRSDAGEDVEELADTEEALETRTEELLEQLRELRQEIRAEQESRAAEAPEGGEDAERSVEDAIGALEQGDSALEQMAEAREELRKNRGQEALPHESKATQRLGQARDALKQAAGQLQAQRRAVNLEKVVKMVRLGLDVSDREEKVVGEAFRESVDLKASCRRLAASQDVLYRGAIRFERRFEEALDDELEIKESFITAVSDIVDTLREAKDSFEQVRPFTARQLARTGLVKLNQVLARLLDIQEEMQDSMSQASMDQLMEDLQRMIERQKKLNDQTARLPRDPARDEAHRRMLEEMAEQQGEMRQELEKLRERAEDQEGLLGDLGEVGKDMEAVEEALRAMEAGEETRQRQRRIVTRMLDMAQSIHEQGESRKREARRARRFEPSLPPPVPPDLAEVRRRFFENREREGYPLEDQEAVEDYLGLLAEEGETLPLDDAGLDAELEGDLSP